MDGNQFEELNKTLKDVKLQLSGISTYLETITKILALSNGITIVDSDEKSD